MRTATDSLLEQLIKDLRESFVSILYRDPKTREIVEYADFIGNCKTFRIGGLSRPKLVIRQYRFEGIPNDKPDLDISLDSILLIEVTRAIRVAKCDWNYVPTAWWVRHFGSELERRTV